VLLLVACTYQYDPNYELDPSYVLTVAGFDKDLYADGLKNQISQTNNSWALGDIYLILARLENKSEYYQEACLHFSKYEPQDEEEKALLMETLGSINCNNYKTVYFRKAADVWRTMGVGWRAELLERIMVDEHNDVLEFETSSIKPNLNLSAHNKILIGNTSIEVTADSNVVTQVERVYRDWLGQQLLQDPFRGEVLVVFSERLSYNESSLREDIGWHEGGRVRDLKRVVGKMPLPVTGTLAAQKDGRWYAVDDKGVFQFEIPLDKISYPHTRFLTKDIAMIIDTHGLNMLVEQSIRKKAEVVVSDCDFPGKAKAAKYLSDRGVEIVCFPDRFVYQALGHDLKLVGSPVWRAENKRVVYGGAPIELRKGQIVVVSSVKDYENYGLMYYDAPSRYFSEINKTFPLKLISVGLDDFSQLQRVFDEAEKLGGNVVGARIFSQDDYEAAKVWLEGDGNNKIVLFHSTMYPYGIVLMEEFEGQVSFNDPNPVGLVS